MVASRLGAMVGMETAKEPEEPGAAGAAGEPGKPGDLAPLMEEDEVVTLTPAEAVVVVEAVEVGHLAVVELTLRGGEVPGA